MDDILDKTIDTGMIISDLPANYIKENVTKIFFRVIKDSPEVSDEKEGIDFDIRLPLPKDAETGEEKTIGPKARLTVLIKDYPQNKLLAGYLVNVSDYPTLSFCAVGHIQDGKFSAGHLFVDKYHSTNLVEKKSRDENTDAVLRDFKNLLDFIINGKKPKRLKSFLMTRHGLRIYYDLFKDNYPEELQEWLDYTVSFGKPDKASRFLEVDWCKKELNLPDKEEAYKILDETVYGMQKVKDRIIAILEIVRRSGRLNYNILLSGPAGVGKTTIIQAMSRIFNLPMSIIPMAGIQDVDAFTGFASTYNASQEGMFTTFAFEPKFYDTNGKATVSRQISQIVFLNELDKVCSESFHGSVQSVLLRMLDDNRQFYDNYYETSFPLDNVMIIADVNDIDKLQKPLIDRFMVIEVEGYSTEEKEHIFREFVFPKALKQACVASEELQVCDEAVKVICQRSNEPGIRELRHMADTIIGDYLVHYSGTDKELPVVYSAKMVKALDFGYGNKGMYFRI